VSGIAGLRVFKTLKGTKPVKNSYFNLNIYLIMLVVILSSGSDILLRLLFRLQYTLRAGHVVT
jgi:hypothetical protein